jgi:hypothetical protein
MRPNSATQRIVGNKTGAYLNFPCPQEPEQACLCHSNNAEWGIKEKGCAEKMGSEWILGRLAWRGVDWIRLAQDRDRWRAVMSAVMNLRVFVPRS